MTRAANLACLKCELFEPRLEVGVQPGVSQHLTRLRSEMAQQLPIGGCDRFIVALCNCECAQQLLLVPDGSDRFTRCLGDALRREDAGAGDLESFRR